MDSRWAYFQPWVDTLRAFMLLHGEPDPESPGSELQISLQPLYPKVSPPRAVYPNLFYLRLSVDEVGRQDRKRLQHLREAIELISAVAVVDNKAYTDLMRVDTFTYFYFMPDKVFSYHPKWIFCFFGTLPSQDPAATQYDVSFGALLGFPDDPWTYSTDFREAVDKLEAMGLNETLTQYDFSEFAIDWEIKNSTVNFDSRCEADPPGDAPRPLSTQLKKLLDINVPPVVQLCATGNDASVVKRLQETRRGIDSPMPPANSRGSTTIQPASSSVIHMDHLDFSKTGIPAVTTALARTATQRLSLEYDRSDGPDTVGATMNAGYLLSTLLCGRSTCGIRSGNLTFPTIARDMGYDELNLKFEWVSYTMFAAIYSAVAGLSLVGKVDRLDISRIRSSTQDQLPWVLYALCRGSSSVSIRELRVGAVCLTEAALDAVKATLKDKFPAISSSQASETPPEYGFVEMDQGAQFQVVLSNGSGIVFEVSSPTRCRARVNPSLSPQTVDAVIPGYGLCRVALKDKVSEFIRDAPESYVFLRQPTASVCALRLSFETVEDGALVAGLIGLAAWRLKKLSLCTEWKRHGENDPATHATLDLSALAEACPDLENLQVSRFNVVVTARNNALRAWKVQKIDIYDSESLPDLEPCLSDPSYRMARELAVLKLSGGYNWNYDVDEIKALNAHDGDCLSLTKERLPSQSKAALISVVKSRRGGNSLKAVHLLDALCLGRIFAFVSTPVQRSVQCDE